MESQQGEKTEEEKREFAHVHNSQINIFVGIECVHDEKKKYQSLFKLKK
jgi:hypothetical protein